MEYSPTVLAKFQMAWNLWTFPSRFHPWASIFLGDQTMDWMRGSLAMSLLFVWSHLSKMNNTFWLQQYDGSCEITWSERLTVLYFGQTNHERTRLYRRPLTWKFWWRMGRILKIYTTDIVWICFGRYFIRHRTEHRAIYFWSFDCNLFMYFFSVALHFWIGDTDPVSQSFAWVYFLECYEPRQPW